MEYSDLKIEPNPATSTIQISTDENVDELVIFNISGSIVMNDLDHNTPIDVSTLPDGMYIIHIKTEKGLRRSRFIKN